MLLSLQLHLHPTRTENTLACTIISPYWDCHRCSFFPRTVREWNILPQEVMAKYCWILQERCTPHVTLVTGTPLQCIAYGSVGSRAPYREEPEDVNSLLYKLFTFITCSCLMDQWLFLQDHTITTCAGVFILLKLVQYLSRRRTMHKINCNAPKIACKEFSQ